MLNERKPDSTCIIGTCNLAAAIAPASVEFVSPYTNTQSGFSVNIISSIPINISAVILPCEPPETFKL